MTLREEIRRLAKKTYEDRLVVSIPAIESAILEGVKLVLERRIGDDMLQAMDVAYLESGGGSIDGVDDSVLIAIYRAMTQELLKELNG